MLTGKVVDELTSGRVLDPKHDKKISQTRTVVSLTTDSVTTKRETPGSVSSHALDMSQPDTIGTVKAVK